MLIDGDTVLAGAGVAGSLVEARIVGEANGPKIRGFTYKNKSRGRKSWGHRQHYTTIEITAISKGEA
jgi:large subunit ribosomal protein L21